MGRIKEEMGPKPPRERPRRAQLERWRAGDTPVPFRQLSYTQLSILAFWQDILIQLTRQKSAHWLYR